MRWVGHVACMRDRRVNTGFWWDNLKDKGPPGTSRHRWKYNIKVNLNYMGWEGRDWVDLDQDRNIWWALVNAAPNFQVQ